MVRVGGGYFDPDSTSGKLVNPQFFPEFERFDYDLSDEWTWQFSAMFMPVDHFGIEYNYQGESDHDHKVRVNGTFMGESFSDKFKVSSLDRNTSVLTFNWFPVCPESWIQPYVGVGTSYTEFDSANVKEGFNEFLADFGDAIGPARFSVKDSWGWVGQIGIDMLFGRDSNWLVNAAVQYHDVDFSSALYYPVEGLTNLGSTRTFENAVRASFEPDPWIWNVGVGYKF
ncbi:OmpW/AlkL family protein [Microbulbifer taiwanensis]|uniref:OmpW family protein n=1 Tax=Microbulbifer taiwanensis TaxID=986746 RepID=A0ABW1YT22_9GAMM|nr:OmpW family outer membrane protein [Microbulbifer taiwanensis]